MVYCFPVHSVRMKKKRKTECWFEESAQMIQHIQGLKVIMCHFQYHVLCHRSDFIFTSHIDKSKPIEIDDSIRFFPLISFYATIAKIWRSNCGQVFDCRYFVLILLLKHFDTIRKIRMPFDWTIMLIWKQVETQHFGHHDLESICC